MTFGSLFAGIGGLDLGLERAGMECRWQVEIDEYCRRVLAKHWPDVTRYEDVKNVGAHNLEPVELVCGGFPCQPVSQAGAQRAEEDERWLWPEMRRIVRELRPRFVLVENVAGLTFRGMGRVLGDLATLGYDAEWEMLPACAFGAGHVRERVFIVAHTDSDRLPPVFPARRPCSYPYNPDGKPETTAAGWPNVELVSGEPSGWAAQPGVGRVVQRLPNRVDIARIAALGNMVVPRVAEWVGFCIIEAARGFPVEAG